MKTLELVDHFDCTPDEFWELFLDPVFTAELDAEAGLVSREELMIEDDEEKFHSRFRITPKRELPPHVQQMLQNGLKFLQQIIDSGSSTDDLPEPMRKLIGWGKSTFKGLLKKSSGKGSTPNVADINLSYIEEGLFRRDEKVLHWSITPELFKDVCDFTGTIEVFPEEGGCRRVIKGRINLAIPGIGEALEQHLIDDIEKHHQAAAALTRKWLASGRGHAEH